VQNPPRLPQEVIAFGCVNVRFGFGLATSRTEANVRTGVSIAQSGTAASGQFRPVGPRLTKDRFGSRETFGLTRYRGRWHSTLVRGSARVTIRANSPYYWSPRKFSSAVLKSSGFCRNAKWLVLGRISSPAPGMVAAMYSVCARLIASS
jgi:hypothetical protein